MRKKTPQCPQMNKQSHFYNPSALLHALTLLIACMVLIDKSADWPIRAVYICFCIYAHRAGFVRKVPKNSERDFSLVNIENEPKSLSMWHKALPPRNIHM